MHLQLLQKPVYDHRLMRPAAWQLRLVLSFFVFFFLRLWIFMSG